MNKTASLFVMIAAVACLCGSARAAGKFSGGAGGGFASGSASAGLGGSSLALAVSADQAMERAWTSVAANAMTITDGSPAAITAAGDIRLIISASLAFVWDSSATAPAFGGSAMGKVAGTVTFENGGKTAVIDVTSDFAANDTLTVSGLAFTNAIQACAAERLALDVQNDGKPDAWADKGASVTVPRPGGPGDGSDGYTMTQEAPLFASGTMILIR